MWTKIGNKIFIISLIMFCVAPIFGQHKAYFEISSNEVSVNETFQLALVLENPEKGASFSFPPPAGFQVLGGPNRSNSMSVVNGKASETYKISYYLKAQKTGQFTISNAYYLDAKKNKEAVQPIRINVTKDGNVNVPKNKNIFATIETNKNTTYVGQAVKVALKIYIRQGMVNQLLKSELKESESVWMEREDKMEPYTKRKIINGMSFTEITIDEFLLYPQKSGDLAIGPWDTEVNVPISFFQDKQVKLNAPAKTIKVEALPGGVSGSNVGAYEISHSLSEGPYSSGSPIDFKIKIKGTGNFSLLNPSFTEGISEDIDVYEPKIINKTAIASNGTQGYKEWQYILMPTIDGKYEIPAFELKTFDPFSKQIKTLRIPAQEIIVGKGSYATNSSGTDQTQRIKKDINLNDGQKAYISNDSRSLMSSWMYSYGFILSSLFILILYIFIRMVLNSPWYAQWRSKQKEWDAIKSLQALTDEDTEIQAKIDDILSTYFSTLFQVPKSEIVWNTVAYKLQVKNISPDIIQSLKSNWDRINYSKYTGWGPGEKATCIQELIKNIAQLNEKWS